MAAVVVLWIFCGLGSALIASNKNRNPFVWGLIGAAFGPLGVVISLAMGTAEPVPAKGTTKACPYCAETIQAAAIVCKHCGKDLKAAEAEAAAAQTATNEKARHQALQDAIATGNLAEVRAILDSGIDVSASPLPISHQEYAEMYGNAELVDLIKNRLAA